MRRLVPLLALAFAACADQPVGVPDGPDFARIHEAEGSHGGTPFMAVLVPEEETAPIGGDPGEDPRGVIVFTLNSGQEEICFKTSFSGLSSTVSAAHIHPGALGETNPPVVPLDVPPFPAVSEGVVAQCVFADRDVIKAIRKNPELYYVNIHTRNTGSIPEVGRPAGAIRGQMFKTQGSNVNHF